MNYNDVLSSNNGKLPEGLAAFDQIEAAPEFKPIPPGIYKARVLRGEYTTTKTGADAYRIRFEIIEGPQTGQTIIRTWTFTPRALPYTKRDLLLFGLDSSVALLSPFPEPNREYVCQLVVALQRGDDGREFNDIKRIQVLHVEPSAIAEYLLSGRREGETQ